MGLLSQSSGVSHALGDLSQQASRFYDDNKSVILMGTGAATLVLAGAALWRRCSYSPSGLELSMGNLDSKESKSKWSNYVGSFDKGDLQNQGKTGAGEIVVKESTVSLVDDFYNFVTDIYEWGWGQSFHFSPRLPQRDLVASEVASEARIAHLVLAEPGKNILDAGCGVGGPMRMVAAISGANVTGVTINAYQVQRCKRHNAKMGLDKQCTVLQGDFHKLPFPDNHFDGVYACEATCHAPVLEDVYRELFRVLKPGGRFMSQEWVSTPLYDKRNAEHERIIKEINFGNGLPEMRTWKEAEDAGEKVGFKLVQSYDAAICCSACGPWYERLSKVRFMHHVNAAIVNTLAFFWLIPQTVKDVHKMLVNVALSLTEGGETGVFTPMQIIVFEKPRQ